MIRQAVSEDISELKQLVLDEWYWPFFTDSHYTKLLYTESDKIVGVASLSITLATANIDHIFVAESARSQGVGHKLMKAIRDWCIDQEAEGLTVNCGEENVKAQKFYEKEGFEQVGKVFNYFSNDNWQIFYWRKV